MIIHIAHKEHILISLKSHAIFSINIGFKDTFHPFYKVTAQSRMPEVRIKQAECFIRFPLYGLR